MCSMILLALNTFLATPGCVTADGPATATAQRWGAYELGIAGDQQSLPIYGYVNQSLFVGDYSRQFDTFVGFTWFRIR